MELRLTEAQRRSFLAEGFLKLEQITLPAEIEDLKRLYDSILSDVDGLESVEYTGIRENKSREVLKQVIRPDVRHPELRRTVFYRNACRIASALLGLEHDKPLHGHRPPPEDQSSLELLRANVDQLLEAGMMMMYKPPNAGRPLFWHQDEPYYPTPDLKLNAVTMWMPLDPVEVDSGCMQFVPGSHLLDVLEYLPEPDAEPPQLILQEDVDPSTVVACPLPAGGATFHHCRTLHFTAANTSPVPRRVITATFHGPAQVREKPLDRPWIDRLRLPELTAATEG